MYRVTGSGGEGGSLARPFPSALDPRPTLSFALSAPGDERLMHRDDVVTQNVALATIQRGRHLDAGNKLNALPSRSLRRIEETGNCVVIRHGQMGHAGGRSTHQ